VLQAIYFFVNLFTDFLLSIDSFYFLPVV
jgi:hypothetical protein